jgi:uncharacterized protein (DUF169 family)
MEEPEMRKAELQRIQDSLGLSSAPIALAFLASPPAGLRQAPARQAAGCGYWKLAATSGQAFYTDATDHFGCTIGAHTHGVPLPPEKAQELNSMIETMLGLEYLRADELPSLPQRSEPFGVVVYAPASQVDFEPDVVMVRGTSRQIMLLSEAARLVGAFDGRTLGRPACAMIPAAMKSGQAVSSFGCIGNRVYTELADDEIYFSIPGSKLAAIADKLATILEANRTLEGVHRERRAAAEAQV